MVVVPHIMLPSEWTWIHGVVHTPPLVRLATSEVPHMTVKASVDEEVVGGLPSHVTCVWHHVPRTVEH